MSVRPIGIIDSERQRMNDYVQRADRGRREVSVWISLQKRALLVAECRLVILTVRRCRTSRTDLAARCECSCLEHRDSNRETTDPFLQLCLPSLSSQ